MAFSSAPHLHCLPWTSAMKLVSLSTNRRNCRRGLSSNCTNRVLNSLSVSASRSSIRTDQSKVETEKNTGSALRELCEGHVPDHVMRRVEEVGYVAPTPVQSEALPVLFSGRDCVIHAQTGSGKTLAYLLLLLSVVNPQRSSVQALIVVPTRELGMQICGKREKYSTLLHLLQSDAPQSAIIFVGDQIGSTEWVEENRQMLGSRVVAYLNVDVAVAGAGN